MTKKDYIMIAKLIKNKKQNTQGLDWIELNDLIDGLCEVLKSDNPNFDKARFLSACK